MIEWFRQLDRASRDAEATGITFGQQPVIASSPAGTIKPDPTH